MPSPTILSPVLLSLALVCWPAWSDARAADTAPDDVCSARFSSAPRERQVEAMRLPVQQAIATLDNTEIGLPSPSLASGNVNYVDITPNFAERIDQVCVLAYFELARRDSTRGLPLRVDHIDIVKRPHPTEPNQTVASTRIYFRTPGIEDFDNAGDLKSHWKFWQRHQPLTLRIAAFRYGDGRRGAPFFGHKLEILVSAKSPSVVAALLFAALFYLLAAATIPSGRQPGQGWLANGWRSLARRFAPWRITGANAQASLSQLQMLLFTLIVATLLFYQWLRTGLLQDISTDLLYLIGLSTAGAAGTQIVASVKKELDPPLYRYLLALGWFNAPLTGADRQAGAGELLMTNQRFDIYKFQMLVFTCVIAAYVIASGADELGNIRISAPLLTLMGMSQGAYVGGRAAGDELTPLQDQLRGMQALQQRLSAGAESLATAELQRRLALAAADAGALFGALFGRSIPAELLAAPMAMPAMTVATPIPDLPPQDA